MQQSAINLERDKKGWMTIALHVLIWLMVFLIPYIFSADVGSNSNRAGHDQNMFLYLNTALNFFWVGLFYFNAGLLIPRFIYKKNCTLCTKACRHALRDDIFGLHFIPGVCYSTGL
ncbi:MAG: hypothetical protein ABIS01_17035 [Ferruginibacter sp.]